MNDCVTRVDRSVYKVLCCNTRFIQHLTMPACGLCDKFIGSAGDLRGHLGTVHKVGNVCDTLAGRVGELELIVSCLCEDWDVVRLKDGNTEENIQELLINGLKMDTELPVLNAEDVQQEFNLLNVENIF